MPRQTGAALATAGVVATITTHAAVLARTLPATAVSGGRVRDERVARQLAIGSILSQVPVVFLVGRGAGWLGRATTLERRLLAVLAGAGAISVPLQLAGTRYERMLMATTAAALATGFARLSLDEDRDVSGC